MSLEEFSLNSKNEKESIAIYKAVYKVSEENLTIIDSIKNNDKDNSLFKIKEIGNLSIYGNLIKELTEMKKKEKEIKYKTNYDDYMRFNYMKELGGSGLELIDSIAMERFSKVMGYMIKNLGKNFFNGKNITQVALPIYINDERSNLEM